MAPEPVEQLPLAAILAQLLLSSFGLLATIPVGVRIDAASCGFIAFLLIRRSVFAGGVVGEGVLLLGGFVLVS